MIPCCNVVRSQVWRTLTFFIRTFFFASFCSQGVEDKHKLVPSSGIFNSCLMLPTEDDFLLVYRYKIRMITDTLVIILCWVFEAKNYLAHVDLLNY